jgi:hypothetical protein
MFLPHPNIVVSMHTLINDSKASIKSIDLDLARFASHLAKGWGTLAAVEAGLDVAGLATVCNWSSPDMAARYIRGTEAYCNSLIDQFCPKLFFLGFFIISCRVTFLGVRTLCVCSLQRVLTGCCCVTGFYYGMFPGFSWK